MGMDVIKQYGPADSLEGRQAGSSNKKNYAEC